MITVLEESEYGGMSRYPVQQIQPCEEESYEHDDRHYRTEHIPDEHDDGAYNRPNGNGDGTDDGPYVNGKPSYNTPDCCQ